MRHRGAKFWEWADLQLHHREHEERLPNGTLIDVQVRLSREGFTQLFLGVYARDGSCLCEEFHPERSAQTMTAALKWGVDTARLEAAKHRTSVGIAAGRRTIIRRPKAR